MNTVGMDIMKITRYTIVIITIILIALLITGCNINAILSQKIEPNNSATSEPIATVKPTVKSTPHTLSESEAIIIAKQYPQDHPFTLSGAVGVRLTDFPTVTYANNTGKKYGYYQILVKGYFYGKDDYGTQHKYYFDWTIEVSEDTGWATGKTLSVK